MAANKFCIIKAMPKNAMRIILYLGLDPVFKLSPHFDQYRFAVLNIILKRTLRPVQDGAWALEKAYVRAGNEKLHKPGVFKEQEHSLDQLGYSMEKFWPKYLSSTLPKHFRKLEKAVYKQLADGDHLSNGTRETVQNFFAAPGNIGKSWPPLNVAAARVANDNGRGWRISHTCQPMPVDEFLNFASMFAQVPELSDVAKDAITNPGLAIKAPSSMPGSRSQVHLMISSGQPASPKIMDAHAKDAQISNRRPQVHAQRVAAGSMRDVINAKLEMNGERALKALEHKDNSESQDDASRAAGDRTNHDAKIRLLEAMLEEVSLQDSVEDRLERMDVAWKKLIETAKV